MGHLDPALLTVIITAGAGLLTGLAQLSVALAGYFRSKSERASISSKLDQNTAITQQTAKATDGIVSQLVASTKQASFAEGVKDQVDKQAAIQAAVDAAPLAKPQEKPI
jgi:hypothetical protein